MLVVDCYLILCYTRHIFLSTNINLAQTADGSSKYSLFFNTHPLHILWAINKARKYEMSKKKSGALIKILFI